jgi:hypothetical protein
MRKNKILPWLYILPVVVMIAAAGIARASCRNDTSSFHQYDEQIAIYAVVIQRLATTDDTFGGNLKPPVLYILKNTDDRAGDPRVVQSSAAPIPDEVQKQMVNRLNDLAEVVWIDKFADATWVNGPGSEVQGGGAIITLGNITRQTDGSVHVPGSIYIANTGAGGTTYILEKIGNTWIITGRTGGSWMS